MKITKERLVAALNLAKSAKVDADAAKADADKAKADLATAVADRDAAQADAAIVNDPDVTALVDELVPAPAEPAPVV